MTTDQELQNHVTAQLEAAVTKRTKDGLRFNVTLSFPFKANKPLAMFLQENMESGVLDVDFTRIQPTLPESTTITGPAQKIETVEVLTTDVDGAPALVTIPVREGGRRNAIAPHPYKADPENASKCLHCSKGEGYQAHDASRIDAAAQQEILKVKSNGHRANPTELAEQGAERAAAMQEAGQTPHAFVAHRGDNQCEACGQGDGAEVHDADLRAGSDLPEHMRATAESLIAQAQATEAVPSA